MSVSRMSPFRGCRLHGAGRRFQPGVCSVPRTVSSHRGGFLTVLSSLLQLNMETGFQARLLRDLGNLLQALVFPSVEREAQTSWSKL